MGNVIEDLGLKPLVNNNFVLRVDVNYDLPCRKISSIQMEEEYETIQEGGVNDYVHIRKKPASKPYTFQVERYVGEKYFDPLPLGRIVKDPIVLYISRYVNDFKNAKYVITFRGCTVIGKTYGDLDAESSGLYIETTTIAFQQIEVENKTS